MELKSLQDLLPYCKNNALKRRLAVIKAEDDHTLTAVMQAANEGVIYPILIGDSGIIKNLLMKLDIVCPPHEIIDEADGYRAALLAIRMVHENKVDFLMKGTLETKELMKVIVARESNMRTERMMSKVDFIENPGYHKLFALSDSALNPKPDLIMKKQIIENALDVLHHMGITQPKVAVLAASETLNKKLQESTDAFELKQMYERGEITGCILEGPISIDLAMEPESVRIKKYPGVVGGDADLLICPDLVSGNLMGKGMLITGAKAAGIIVGAKVPVVLTSRAASIEDKMQSILLGVIAAKKED